jgi:dihydrofolate reductase
MRHGCTTALPENPATAARTVTLAQLGGGTRAYIDGGVVIRQFLAANLIDDLTISVIPTVLGAGIRLFPGGEGEHSFVFESSQSWSSGLVQLRYRTRA